MTEGIQTGLDNGGKPVVPVVKTIGMSGMASIVDGSKSHVDREFKIHNPKIFSRFFHEFFLGSTSGSSIGLKGKELQGKVVKRDPETMDELFMPVILQEAKRNTGAIDKALLESVRLERANIQIKGVEIKGVKYTFCSTKFFDFTEKMQKIIYEGGLWGIRLAELDRNGWEILEWEVLHLGPDKKPIKDPEDGIRINDAYKDIFDFRTDKKSGKRYMFIKQDQTSFTPIPTAQP